MHATLAPTPPPTPEPGAAWSEFRQIRVTRVVEDSGTSPEDNVEVRRPGHCQEITAHTQS